jgi:hypothetical protein
MKLLGVGSGVGRVKKELRGLRGSFLVYKTHLEIVALSRGVLSEQDLPSLGKCAPNQKLASCKSVVFYKGQYRARKW